MVAPIHTALKASNNYAQYGAEISPQQHENLINTGTRQTPKNRSRTLNMEDYRLLGYLRYVYAKLGVIAVAITYYLVLVTFLTAYTHPAYAVTVTIDTYHEAELELAFMLLSLPAAARFILNSLKQPNETTAPTAKPTGNPTSAPPMALQSPPFKVLETSME